MEPSTPTPASTTSAPAPAAEHRTFRRLALGTTVLTYFLISVGAIVRVSGAGMGCPDWPRCFGLLIPPTSAADLPPLSTYSYPPGWSVESFDPLMTWIEFLNRLLGAAVGLAILATLIVAVARLRQKPGVVVPVVVAFFGVLFAAWLGGRVVAHELAPWMVTAHLLSAIVVVSALVVAVVNATPAQGMPTSPGLAWGVWGVVALAGLQGAVGTQVRGTLDDIARHHPELARGARIDLVGVLDMAHRNLALLVVAAVVVVVIALRKRLPGNRQAQKTSTWAAVVLGAQFVIGIALVYAGLPHVLQVAHLLCGALLLGLLTATAMQVRRG